MTSYAGGFLVSPVDQDLVTLIGARQFHMTLFHVIVNIVARPILRLDPAASPAVSPPDGAVNPLRLLSIVPNLTA